MHICMICQDFPPMSRGVGYYVYNLSKELIEMGYKVTVFTRGSWKRTHFEDREGINVYRVQFIPLYPFHLQFHGYFINRLLRSMESTIDVVHLHNPLIPVINTSLPIVITEHGTVKGGIFRREALDLFSLGLNIFSKLYISIERELLSCADKVTAVSDSCAEELRLYYGIEKIRVVYNGVDTDFFTPNNIDNEDRPSILYAGSLDALKGLFDLIMCAEYVCKIHNTKFIIAGRGPLEKKLKKFTKKCGLSDHFSFIGQLDQDMLLLYYQNASIFVHPSYHEGLPTAILEAMSCGLPIVATAVAGTSEIIKDGETGLLVPSKSPKKLAEAIIKLLDDQKLRKKIGENGREFVRKSYDWNLVKRNFEKVYKEMMDI